MKKIFLLVTCIALFSGCATNKPDSKVTQQDLNMFKKTFEGTLLEKNIEPFSREENVMGIPFWSNPVTAQYLLLTVMDENGVIRKFYDYSEEENRKDELKQYHNELETGDIVIIDIGFIDEENPEELFDSVTKK